MSVIQYLNNAVNETSALSAQEISKQGLNKVLQRPPFESLPGPVQEFVKSLEGLETHEQFDLVRQFTQGMVKYGVTNDEYEDMPKTFAQTLASLGGNHDCDDIVVFEAGLLQYAKEQGIAHFDEVAIVGGRVIYDWEKPDGEYASKEINHNFLVISSEGQNFYSDPNSPHIAALGENEMIENGSLLNSKGETVNARVTIFAADFVQNVTTGAVNVSDDAELLHGEGISVAAGITPVKVNIGGPA